MFPTREGKSFNAKPKKPVLTTLYPDAKPAESRLSPGKRQTGGLKPQKSELGLPTRGGNRSSPGELVPPTPAGDGPRIRSAPKQGDGRMGMGMAPGPGNGFGARLREVRENRSMSRAALAKKVDVSEAAIKNYESARHDPRLTTIMNLAAALRVAPASLLMPEGSIIPAPRRLPPKLLWWIPLAASLVMASHVCTYCFSDQDNAGHDHDAHLWGEHTVG